jgi:hypothetical protein
MLTGIGGSSVPACDGRRDVGAPCAVNTDCLTARCGLGGSCAPAEGAANGASCTVASDCKSNSCVSNYCKGNAQVGDPCTVIIDCATGTCCSNLCKTAC